MTTPSPDRILSLDVIRGTAVMGIFSVNVVGMAMIEQAYFYPPAFGFESLGDRIMWAANFVLVDHKFRSLFSILFGASMVLVIERGIAAGKEAWQVHFPRMIVLLLFGLAHFFVLWWGDILANYALIGMVAFLFWRLPTRPLLLAAALALAAMHGPAILAALQETTAQEPPVPGTVEAVYPHLFPTEEVLAQAKADHASIPAHWRATLEQQPARPFASVNDYGLETLGLMLLGMAGYRSGYLTGAWRRRRYAQVAAVTIGASVALYGFAAWRILATAFDPLTFYPWQHAWLAAVPPFAAFGYAALVILLLRPGGALTERVAAVGRAAFSNYLGATLVGTVLFFGSGLGLFGQVSRGEAWLFVPPVWAAMLLWSKAWLDRFRYGPFEWAWRSLARWRWEPMRRQAMA